MVDFSAAINIADLPQGVLSWEDAEDTLHQIEGGITVSFDASRGSKLTQHAMEDGAEATDHITLSPRIIKITLQQSTVPDIKEKADGSVAFESIEIQPPDSNVSVFNTAQRPLTAGFNALLDSVTPLPVARILTTESTDDQIVAMHRQLEDVQAKALPLTITTVGASFPRYFITQLGYSRKGPEELGTFVLECEQARFVTTSIDALLAVPADLRMTPSKPRGNRPGKEIIEEVEKTTRSKSALAAGWDLLS